MACSAPQLRETSPRRRLVAAREAGVLKRWRATPLPRWCYFLGRIIATSAVGALAGAVTVAVGVCFYHAIPTVEAATLILILIYFPVLIVSGLLGSISEPHWLTTLASYLPVRPLADAVTSALRHASGTPLFPAHDVLTLAVWAAAGLAAAIITFRWEPHRPTQRRAARATPARDEPGAPTARPALAAQPRDNSQSTAMR
jgi:ABC-2 type transport system permease protein